MFTLPTDYVNQYEPSVKGGTSRYLYEEFDLPDRQRLDDAILEIIGIEDSSK